MGYSQQGTTFLIWYILKYKIVIIVALAGHNVYLKKNLVGFTGSEDAMLDKIHSFVRTSYLRHVVIHELITVCVFFC